ncbi:MAG: hypothetical protein ACRCXA_10630 [Peptostreptococcaceae bacterium]
MIDEKIKVQLQNIFKIYNEVEKVLLFGSRARKEYFTKALKRLEEA